MWRPGVIKMRDLHTYVAPERAPTHVTLSRPRRLLDGPTVERRLDRRRGAEHPRGLRPSSMTREEALHYYLEASRYSFADRNTYLADPAYFDVPLERLLSKEYAADAARADHRARRRRRRRRRPVSVQRGCTGGDGAAVGDDDAPDDERQVGQRRLVHVHDRVDRRLGPRRAGLGLPAQQRADRLQLRLDDSPEPRRGRQAAAQLDEPDDRAQGRQAVPGARLAGRVDDHHDRPAAARRPARPRPDAAAGDRRSAREPAQHGDDERRAGVPRGP